MDQPAGEIRTLEKIIEVFSRYDDHREKIEKTRQKNRARHAPTRIRNN